MTVGEIIKFLSQYPEGWDVKNLYLPDYSGRGVTPEITVTFKLEVKNK